jgi:hypothetical protein
MKDKNPSYTDTGETDENGNPIYYNKYASAIALTENWETYDRYNNVIHKKSIHNTLIDTDPVIFEYWYEYDEKGNEIYYRNKEGYEEWSKYDDKGERVYRANNNKGDFGHLVELEGGIKNFRKEYHDDADFF